MATELKVMDVSYLAAEDLSSDQYKFVVLTSSGTVRRPDSELEVPLGILQNDPASGEVAVVRIHGISKLSASKALAIGTFVKAEYVSASDAGKGKRVTANPEYARGIVLEASGAEDDVASVLLIGPFFADSRCIYETFDVNPVCALKAGGASGGTAGNVNVMSLGKNMFEYHIIGTQTITAPSLTTGGLLAGLDDANGDGVEYTNGITADSPVAFTVGTDAFFFRCKFSVADVSGAAECAVGFRTVEAYQAAIDDYLNMACLNMQGGAINIETIDDNNVTTTTDTTDTWADGETHTFEVRIAANRAVTYLIDGAAPSTTAAFSFDATDVVIPFFHFKNGADAAGNIIIQEWEVGLQ